MVPVYYKGKVIGHSEGGNISIDNVELWNDILLANSNNILVSSRAIGTIDSNGKVIEKNIEYYDILSKTKEDEFKSKRELRNFDRKFKEGEVVCLNENWMLDSDKECEIISYNENDNSFEEKFKVRDFLGLTGKVISSDSHYYDSAKGSLYTHQIKWSNGVVTTYGSLSAPIQSSFLEKVIKE